MGDILPALGSAAGGPDVRVEIVRSARRTRTVSAARQGDRIVVRVPARLPRADVEAWVERLVGRVLAAEARRRPSDTQLLARAAELSARHLGGAARPVSVRWSDGQRKRWGSCTPVDGSIRISRRLAGVPAYVLDYVLLHELVHLLEPGHGRGFRARLAAYPEAARAEAFLDGWTAAERAAAGDPGSGDDLEVGEPGDRPAGVDDDGG